MDKQQADEQPGWRRPLGLSLAALGVVYGDIGTSPLYALRQCLFGAQPVAVVPANVLGILSLVFWSLILVISVKYLAFIMRADNDGEGGILALLASLEPWRRRAGGRRVVLIAMGLFGAALLYGDGMITPAISVLSAVEGLNVTAPALAHYVIPITIAILIGLFAFQHHGTGRVGAIFGPLMLVWFVTLAAIGLHGIAGNPQILRAVDPLYAGQFFVSNGWEGFLVLGAVFLAVTGGETVYADMGHFGPFPIRAAWFALVLPALLLNYFGQGAYILMHPAGAMHPFYNAAPHWARYPLIALATVATVIASQAVISGAFSLARQAVQLGQSPRLHVVQTSAEEIGQIYIPAVNTLLMVACIGLVLGFRSSSRLAGAYGVAVSTTMLITTVLAYFVMRDKWRWRPSIAAPVALVFLTVDLAFLLANLDKVPEGGWFPLLVAALVYFVMQTWNRGRRLLARQTDTIPVKRFLADLHSNNTLRVPGTAVFLVGENYWPNTSPILLHHLNNVRSIHERVILLTVLTDRVPRVPAAGRLDVKALDEGFFHVLVHYGFMQTPNIPVALRLAGDFGSIPDLDADELVYFVGRTTLIASDQVPGMAVWREKFFAFMTRNALDATAFYGIPPDKVVELGLQVEI